MLQSLPHPEPDIPVSEPRNPRAVVDLLAFGMFAVLMFLLMALAMTRLTPIYVVPLQGVFNLALVGFTAVWLRTVRHVSFREYVRLVPSHVIPTRKLIKLGTFLAASVSIVSLFLPVVPPTPLERFLNSPGAIFLFVLFGVAVAPFTEELLFRGFLFQVLREIGGFRLAIVGSAVLFAAPHFAQLGENLGAGLLIFVVGSTLSVIRYRTNSVIPSFVVHTAYNASLVLLAPLFSVLQKALR
jgi:uncharacterized protein